MEMVLEIYVPARMIMDLSVFFYFQNTVCSSAHLRNVLIESMLTRARLGVSVNLEQPGEWGQISAHTPGDHEN